MGQLNLFKMADLFITEDFYRPGTVHEKKNKSDENDRSWYLVEA